MANLKGGAKGQKKKPGDFKRPKRKVGRKVTNSNVTNASIQSRRINMTEQSMLQDKSGAAVTHRNQTLQDILSKISHYNAHVRRDAMHSLKELVHLHPMTLVTNIGLVLERLLQGMVDDEAIVREACKVVWKECFVSLTSSKMEHVVSPFASLIAVYFCSGLTHIKVSVREDVLQHIDAIFDFPAIASLYTRALSSDQCGRLLENLKDLISTKAPTVAVKNSYSLFADKVKAKQGQMQTTILKGRFFAVSVAHKLLRTLELNGEVATARIPDENTELTKTLLIFPEPVLASWSAYSDRSNIANDESQTWPVKALTLIPALLSLWMESQPQISSLSPNVLKHASLIVDCSTIIAKNAKDHFEPSKVMQMVNVFFDEFPMSNKESIHTDTTSQHLLHTLNLSIAQFGCETMERVTTGNLEETIEEYVQGEFNHLLHASGNKANTTSLIKGQLRILSALLERNECTDLLEMFTTLYLSFKPTSGMFRASSVFAIKHLDHVINSKIPLASWDLVLKWMQQLGQYLLVLKEESQEDTHRSLVHVFIGVLRRLPQEHLASPLLHAWSNSIVSFFTHTTSPFWFGQLQPPVQIKAISLLYHLPQYPPNFVRTLAECCKASTVSTNAKSFLIDIIADQATMNKIDRASLLSFYMSSLFAEGNEALSRQICRHLTWLNLGASLASILAPVLAKQDVSKQSHALIHAYLACLKSNSSIYNKNATTLEKRETPGILRDHILKLFFHLLTSDQEETLIPLMLDAMMLCNGIFLDLFNQLIQTESFHSILLQLIRQLSIRNIVHLYQNEILSTMKNLPSSEIHRLILNEMKLITMN